jgi:hypothetical protein
MLVLGIILILLAVGVAAAVIGSGTDDQAVLYGGSVHVPTLVAFLVGAATLLVLMMGLEIARRGARRANQSRKNTKRLRTLEQREAERSVTAGTGPGDGDGREPTAEQQGGLPPGTHDDDLA